MRRSTASYSFVRLCSTVALLCICVVGQCYAQQSRSDAPSLRVLVTDTQQRALAGAFCLLRVAGDKANVAAIAMTDEQGVATFPATLPSSFYTLRVESPRFEPFITLDVAVKYGATTSIDLSLTVADLKESVTVESPIEEATTAAAGSSIPA